MKAGKLTKETVWAALSKGSTLVFFLVINAALARILEPRASAPQRRVNRAGKACRATPDDGQIGAFQRAGAAMVGKLRGQMAVRGVVLGHNHNAGRILVEAVDDPGAAHAANAGKAVTAMVD